MRSKLYIFAFIITSYAYGQPYKIQIPTELVTEFKAVSGKSLELTSVTILDNVLVFSDNQKSQGVEGRYYKTFYRKNEKVKFGKNEPVYTFSISLLDETVDNKYIFGKDGGQVSPTEPFFNNAEVYVDFIDDTDNTRRINYNSEWHKGDINDSLEERFLFINPPGNKSALITTKADMLRKDIKILVIRQSGSLIKMMDPTKNDTVIFDKNVYVLPIIKGKRNGANAVFEVGDPKVNGEVSSIEVPTVGSMFQKLYRNLICLVSLAVALAIGYFIAYRVYKKS